MLTIYLKNGNYISVTSFKRVIYETNGTRKEKTPDSLSELSIGDAVTYNFEGSTKISIRGSEILYVELESN